MAAYQNVVNQAQNQANRPLQQYSGNLVAGFVPQQNEAFNAIGQAQGIANPFINAASQYASNAASPITPMAFQGAGTNGQGLSTMGLNYLGQATQPINVPQWSPQAVQNYMSPYTQNVANATTAQMKNLDAQQQQQVVGNAISSGAWGGDRSAIAQSELANQQNLANSQTMANIYQQGFGQANQQLNTQQQLALQQGTTQAQLAANAGQQAFGEFNAQQQAGLNAQQASGWLGANAATQFGALGQEAQGTALTGAQSELSAGTLQQQLAQQQLNVPYEQFQQQQAWPYQQLGWLAGVTEGTGSQMGGTSSTTSPAPNTFGQTLGGIGALAGGLGLLGLKRGGRVGFANGGSPFDIPDVSLSIIPESRATGFGKGPPAPPGPMQQPSSGGDGIASGVTGLAGAIDKMQANRALDATGNQISMGANAAGIDALGDSAMTMATPMAMTELNPMPFIGGLGEKRGGRVGFGYGGITSYAGSPSGIAIPQLDPGTGMGAPSLGGSRGIATPQLQYSQPSTAPISTASTSNYAPPPVSQAPHTDYYRPGTGPAPAASAKAGQGPNGYTISYGGQTYTIPSMFVNGANWALARGGRVGFDNGGAIQMAGAGLSGQPFNLGNPLIQRAASNFGNMSNEQLQELAVRAGGAGGAQGQLIQRMLMQRHMNPGQGTPPSAADAVKAPESPLLLPSGFGQPSGMKSGGRAGYDGGGDVYLPQPRAGLLDMWNLTRPMESVAEPDIDTDDVAFTPSDLSAPHAHDPYALAQVLRPMPSVDNIDVENRPDIATYSPIAQGLTIPDSDLVPAYQRSIAARQAGLAAPPPVAAAAAQPVTAPGPSPSKGLGQGAPPPPRGLSSRATGFAPTPDVDTWSPGTDDTEAPSGDLARADTEETPAQRSRSLANNPWMALIAAGGAMMASRSPFLGQQLGEGIEAGAKTLQSQGKESAEEDYRNQEASARRQEAEQRAKSLDAEMERFKIQQNEHTEDRAQRLREHQDEMSQRSQDFGLRQQEYGQRVYEMQHETEWTGNEKGPDGNERGVYRSKFDPQQVTYGPAQHQGAEYTDTPLIKNSKAYVDSGAAPDMKTAMSMLQSGHTNKNAWAADIDRHMKEVVLPLAQPGQPYYGKKPEELRDIAESDMAREYQMGMARQGGAGAAAAPAPAGGAAASATAAPPVAGAKQAPDGNWYIADPNRPGKYLQVNQ